MKGLMISLVVGFLVSISAQGQQGATYYRFWQGFKETNLSSEQFLSNLVPFMNSTVNVYQGKGLNNYLVDIPPANKPSYIPDEFALVAFDSQADYVAVNATDAGRQYQASHWQLFDQDNSKSAPMLTLTADVNEIAFNTAYDVLGQPIDLQNSYLMFFLGTRKANITFEDFRQKMTVHIRDVAAKLGPQGLVGYLILATPDYEVAYMIFGSQEQATTAFASPAGQTVANEASEIMDFLEFNGSENFAGSVSPGNFYSTTDTK